MTTSAVSPVADTPAAKPAPPSLTEKAARRITNLARSEAPGAMFRVSVESGGCSGFQYTFGWDTQKAEDDLVLNRDGATVLLDPVTVEYMAGAQIDFVTDLMHQAFKITNPLATASCGCGTSFAI
jgi:iron-sulfur cluster assembly accessory protein